MEFKKQETVQLAHPTISKAGKRFILVSLFGGLSFYGISSLSMIAYDILMKLFG